MRGGNYFVVFPYFKNHQMLQLEGIRTIRSGLCFMQVKVRFKEEFDDLSYLSE